MAAQELNMIEQNPLLYFALAFFVFVWVKTNAFIDFFGRFLGRKYNFFHIKEYLNEPEAVRDSMMFPLYLYVSYPSFITKLLSCPLCLSFWTNLLFCNGSLSRWLGGAFLTLLSFTILDNLYKHGK